MSRPSTASSHGSSQGSSQNSAGTDDSVKSYLSDDSYLKRMQSLDKGFKEMMDDIKILDNNRKVFKERKVQSHIQKRRDPNDTEKRDWNADQVKDYEHYKKCVEDLANANARAVASTDIARDKTRTSEARRLEALEDQTRKCDAAVSAATARLGFLTRYPDAFNTVSHGGHIKAVESALDAAKNAKREMKTQLDKIAEARNIESRKAAARAKLGDVQSAGGSKGKK